jgi:hypothetical protein
LDWFPSSRTPNALAWGVCQDERRKSEYIESLADAFDSDFLRFDAYNMTRSLDKWNADIDLVHILENAHMYFDEAVKSVMV